MPQIELSETNFGRLQKLATPLVDTPDIVIGKLLDQFEISAGAIVTEQQETENIECLNPDSPPSLKYSKPKAIELNGVVYPSNKLYWNTLLMDVIKLAGEKLSKKELSKLIRANHVQYKHEDTGFVYIENSGLSVQGQNADKSWETIYSVSKAMGYKLKIEFRWNQNGVYPHSNGQFLIN